MIFEILLSVAILISIILLIINIFSSILLKKAEILDFKDTLLSYDELRNHAKDVAETHKVSKKIKDVPHLLGRLRENYKIITRAKDLFQNDVNADADTLPAAEWLLDNYYILHEMYLDLENSLAKGFSDGLSIISSGAYRNYPRCYAIAFELLSHTDGEIDENTISSFMESYQTISVLEMNELWSLQLMIKLASMEYIRQLCDKMLTSRELWQKSSEAATFVKDNISLPYNTLKTQFEEKYGSILKPSFVERLVFYLRMQSIKSSQIIPILNSLLENEGYSTDRLVDIEHSYQAWLQIAMGNLITTVRALGTMDFTTVYERISLVEHILTNDPCGIYPIMDTNTKIMYRNKIKSLAKYYGMSEIHIARTALYCAREKKENPYSHIGFYIQGDGISELISKALDNKGTQKKFNNSGNRNKGGYPTLIIVLSVLISIWVTNMAFRYNFGDHKFPFILCLLLCFLPAMELSTLLINILISKAIKPSMLPKIELKEGIPVESPVMVIVPTLLSSKGRAKEIIGQLESVYLSNKLDNVYFTLVADLKDSETEVLPNDEEIIKEAEMLVESLNREYFSEENRFFFLYRKRIYVKEEEKWMSWERKRGAVLEFVRLLKGENNTGFEHCAKLIKNIPKIKYVITLDADTIIPLGAVKKLVGIMLHPLNIPYVDKERKVVTSGYGLIQPRIGINIKSSMASTYSMIYASNAGIDTYSGAVSDTYQDLFGEGIFTGKGIFDVDVYYEVLNDAIPDNKVLSHDLLEGSYLRTGLASDVMLVDSYPSKYNSAVMRLHRWVRGDWQISGYLKGNIINAKREKIKNPLNSISKWKIFDNLRRSLLAPFLILLAILSFTVLAVKSTVLIGFVLIVCLNPFIGYLLNWVFGEKFSLARDKNYARIMSSLTTSLAMSFSNIVFLAHQAYLMTDAILTTLGRLLFTKKKMLQWVTAADMEVLLKNTLPTYWRFMWFSPVLGAVIFGLSLTISKDNILYGALTLIVFLQAPMIAYYLSQPIEEEEEILEADDIKLLRIMARRNWAFYEDFSGKEDNYLPPDNYQEEPTKVTAHRTSPTNIGFLLLSYLGAKDLGYICSVELLDRIDKTLSTIEEMDKWRGHLYNWYETRTLKILKPRYVSTVDSGNFAGYLIVLISALEDKNLLKENFEELYKGIIDTANIYNEDEGKEEKINLDDLTASGAIGKEQIKENLEKLKDRVFNIIKNNETYWLIKLDEQINVLQEVLTKEADYQLEELLEKAQNIIARLKKLLDEMNFKVLYEPKRHLFSIGYNVEEGRLTKSYYDLLASEARLSSFLAIARGEVPAEHWFKLGRKLVKLEGYRGLVSWTGTMFEYLMPLLIMESYKATLLDETYKFVVLNQIKHGELRGIPWGVSESGYNSFDVSLNYQYKAFGIAELALKRGLENDVVIAPYATLMAVMVEPVKAVENIRKFIDLKVYGKYGLYEAVDYTPQRVMGNDNYSIVKSYMAHHQGMGLIAIVNKLKDNIMQVRFGQNHMIKSANIILQEKLPGRTVFFRSHNVPTLNKKPHTWEYKEGVRNIIFENRSIPSIQLLSNGIYSVMITDGGIGYGKMQDTALYRWSREITLKKTGFFIFVQNMNSNEAWSSTFEPLCTRPEAYNIVFAPDKAIFTRKDGSIETKTEVAVSPEDNVEIRRVSIVNHSEKVREFEVTSYCEIIMTPIESDMAHPAFSNLFIRTEYCEEEDTLIASRRPRMEGQPTLWCFMRAVVDGEEVGHTTFETDRFKFIGRNRDISNPAALDVSQPLSNSQGAVIDPVLSIRKRVAVQPGATARITFSAGFEESRDKALLSSKKYGELKNIFRTFELAYTRSHIEACFLGLKPADFIKYMEAAPYLMLFNQRRKIQEEYIKNNVKGQNGLWCYGISGDIPIIALRITSLDELVDLPFYIKAHEFYRHRGIYIDLVIIMEDLDSGYIQPLYMGLKAMMNTTHLRDMLSKKGGYFTLDIKAMPIEDINLVLSYASIYIEDITVSYHNILSSYIFKSNEEQLYNVLPSGRERPIINNVTIPLKLLFDNGFGGFSEDGREYIIRLNKGISTPLPWINVISNSSFGFQITEVGGGCTWAENGRENKLTPWSNDPVTDQGGEIIYLKDTDTNMLFTATPKPIGEADHFIIHHGIGYSIFEQEVCELEQKLTVFAACEDKVKISLLSLINKSSKTKKITLTYYVRPVLGVSDIQTMRGITTRKDKDSNYIVATNGYNSDFFGKVLFVTSSEIVKSYTCDRQEFFGRGGSLGHPRAIFNGELKEIQGAGYDPCIAYSIEISIEANEEKKLVFLLGQAESDSEIENLIKSYAEPNLAVNELERVRNKWDEIIGYINVSTPDKSMDIMLNSWLIYQVTSCRLWARAAFYQSGGAFGFRDQLQDAMALVFVKPEYTRNQILLHASRQFVEGDVQHWWHAEAGKGIRTRYSDDLLWLPYVICDYINSTGDFSILDEVICFLESPVLNKGEDERYEVPTVSSQKATLYEHCIRTMEIGIKRGSHGIPLMGSGDWNDGMNTVGNKGEGESIWLGWFLYEVLKKFIPISEKRGDSNSAEKYDIIANEIVESIEKNAWDGNWYIRAFFDDGTPLGSSQNSECTIDSISQSWAAITGAGKKERVKEALNSIEKYLIDNEIGIIKLLTPPFDKSNLHPGYIKSYLPGVRENGGQYTHAATWVVLAFAKMGMGNRALELYNMINPINHARTNTECLRYKTEPFVMSADVYAVEPNVGRGGWSWYTGAAGWMYRVGIEHILGIKKNNGFLMIDPCIPSTWEGFEVVIKEGNSRYEISIKNPEKICRGVKEIRVDGNIKEVAPIELIDDGSKHIIEVLMGGKVYEG